MSEYDKLLDKLFSSGQYDGLNVLICWECLSIQELTLRILDAAAAVNRLPQTINNGTEFFKQLNPCPDGNYLCPDPNSPFYSGENKDSKYYPYWQLYDYNSMYWLSSSQATNYKFDFKILPQPCLTCYQNCDLHIGLYQSRSIPCAPGNSYYSTDNNIELTCQVPKIWKTG
jgi:hypothetical protein